MVLSNQHKKYPGRVHPGLSLSGEELLLMSVLSQLFLSFMSCDLMSFPFSSARHSQAPF